MTTSRDNETDILIEHVSKIINKMINIGIFLWVAAGVAKLLFLAAVVLILYYMAQIYAGSPV